MKPIIFAVLAGLCWGIGELCTKMVLHTGKVGPMTILLVRAAAALPLAAAVYVIAYIALKSGSEPRAWWHAGTPTMLRLVLGSGVLAGFGGVLFFYLGLRHGELSVVKPIAFVVGPAVAVVLARVVLGEALTPLRIGGIILVLVGVAMIAGSRSQAPAAGAAHGSPSARAGAAGRVFENG